MKNFIRDDANATQLINYEEANRTGYAVFFKNKLSHIIIWYDIEENDSHFQMGTAKLESGALTISYLLSQSQENEYIRDSNLEINEYYDGFSLYTIYNYGEIDINKYSDNLIANYADFIIQRAYKLISFYNEINNKVKTIDIDSKVKEFINKLYMRLDNGFLEKEINRSKGNPKLEYDEETGYELVSYDIPLIGDIFNLSLTYEIDPGVLSLYFYGNRHSTLKKQCKEVFASVKKYLPTEYPWIVLDTSGKGKNAFFSVETHLNFSIEDFNDSSLDLCIGLMKRMFPLAQKIESEIKNIRK